MSRTEAMRKLTEQKANNAALKLSKIVVDSTPSKGETPATIKGISIPKKGEIKAAKIPSEHPMNKKSSKKGRITKSGEVDKRTFGAGRPKVISKEFKNTSVQIHPQTTLQAKAKFGGLRQAIEWAVKNKK